MMQEGQTCTFQVLFTSDIHGAFHDYAYALDKETPTSGFSKIATLMRNEKDSFDGQTFIVDIGDIIQGNGTGPFVYKKENKQSDTNSDIDPKDYRPFPLLAAFDALGYDIVSIGNHEFNFGVDTMLETFKGFKGEKLCGNVFVDKNCTQLLEGFNAYSIKTLKNGLRIAFIGMVSPNITAWDKKHLENYYVLDAATATQQVIANINKNGGADVIILLGHMHTFNELETYGSGAEDVIALNKKDIDLFLGAHFHTRIGAKDNQCVLCETTKFAENIDSAKTYGRVRITATFENGRWHVKNTVGDYECSDVKTHIIAIENDQAVEKATEKAHKSIKNYMENTKIGILTGGPLVPEPEIKGTHSAILQPTPLLHLIASVMLKYAKTDIAAVSLNSYTANCNEGKITPASIARMYVYDNNTIYRVKMTGKQIKQWMEWSHEFFGLTKDGKPDRDKPAVNLDEDLTIAYGTRKVYLHDKFVGLSYDVDLTELAGSRIKNIRMNNGLPLDMERYYTVATTNYRTTTNLTIHDKDGIFRNPEDKVVEDDQIEMDIKSSKNNINMLEWIEEYINDAGGEITNEVQCNWKFINLNWAKEREEAIKRINNGTIQYTYTKPLKKTDI